MRTKYSSYVEHRHIQHSVTTVPLNIKNQIHKALHIRITEMQNKMLVRNLMKSISND